MDHPGLDDVPSYAVENKQNLQQRSSSNSKILGFRDFEKCGKHCLKNT